jgi:hypothetical protein
MVESLSNSCCLGMIAFFITMLIFLGFIGYLLTLLSRTRQDLRRLQEKGNQDQYDQKQTSQQK